jgi:thiamine biosynthesis lipoprotein
MEGGMREARWSYRGAMVRVTVTEARALPVARRLVTTELAALDRVCGRGRADTELSRVHRAAGRPVQISPLLSDLLATALAAAERTGGDVDPTVGATLLRLRLQQPWLGPYGSSASIVATGAIGDWRQVTLREGCLTAPGRVLLDVSATAKARVVQRCADLFAASCPGGVLVGLGRCVATAGTPPGGGWSVALDDDRGALWGGAVATSTAPGRDPVRPGIIDPRTGRPPALVWRSVSVAAPDCVDAKALSVASVIRGYDAVPWLEDLGVTARLVAPDGTQKSIGVGWGAVPAAPRYGR